MTYAAIGGKPLYSPKDALESAQRLGTPTEFWCSANSYTCPRGKGPGVAYTLMLRADLDYLNLNEPQALVWVDGIRELTIPRLWLWKAYCINLGLTTDAGRMYFCEWRDVRQVLSLSAVNQSYNVRVSGASGATGGAAYYNYSTNSGTPWTWQGILNDLWGKLPSGASAGSSPSLPYTPEGTPESFCFSGVSAWDAYNDVLAALHCSAVYNPIDDEFSLKRIGDTQEEVEYENDELKFWGRLIYDYDPITPEASNYPADILGLFPHEDKDVCCEEVEEKTGGGAALSGTVAGTVSPFWGGIDAYLDGDTVTNGTELQARADEIESKYYEARHGWQRMRRHYSGLVQTILPGARVSAVTWRDYGDGAGLITEVKRHFDAREFTPKCRKSSGGALSAVVAQLVDDLCEESSGPIAVEFPATTIVSDCRGEIEYACNPLYFTGRAGDRVVLLPHRQCYSDGERYYVCQSDGSNSQDVSWIIVAVQTKRPEDYTNYNASVSQALIHRPVSGSGSGASCLELEWLTMGPCNPGSGGDGDGDTTGCAGNCTFAATTDGEGNPNGWQITASVCDGANCLCLPPDRLPDSHDEIIVVDCVQNDNVCGYAAWTWNASGEGSWIYNAELSSEVGGCIYESPTYRGTQDGQIGYWPGTAP